jgi:DNA polymerase (family X)
VEQLHQQGRLGEVPGVGKTIAALIGQYLETGTCAKKDEWAKQTPQTVLEIAAIPGIGAKSVRTLYQRYRIATLADLQKALERGELDGVKGIGKRTIEKIRRHTRG